MEIAYLSNNSIYIFLINLFGHINTNTIYCKLVELELEWT